MGERLELLRLVLSAGQGLAVLVVILVSVARLGPAGMVGVGVVVLAIVVAAAFGVRATRRELHRTARARLERELRTTRSDPAHVRPLSDFRD